jgi:hypothetical protein
MKLLIYVLIVSSVGCNLGGGYEKAENALDAGREFIRGTLDGDHQKARFYLLQDTTNLLLIDKQQRNYQQLSREEKRKHRESSIHPLSIQKVNDSVTNYTYFNSYNPKDTTMIRIVKTKGDWLVDLKSILKE